MNILHVHTKGRKLDTLEQLEIYKHTKTNKNDILNEQTQFKSHSLFEHISYLTPHTQHRSFKIRFCHPQQDGQRYPVSYTHLDVYKRQVQSSITFYGRLARVMYVYILLRLL